MNRQSLICRIYVFKLATMALPALALLLVLPTSATTGWPFTPSPRHWGQYGYGPHFRRTHHHQPDFGPPYFTSVPGRHIPFPGYGPNWTAAAPYYGPYSGAPPVSDAVPPPPPVLPRPDAETPVFAPPGSALPTP